MRYTLLPLALTIALVVSAPVGAAISANTLDKLHDGSLMSSYSVDDFRFCDSTTDYSGIDPLDPTDTWITIKNNNSNAWAQWTAAPGFMFTQVAITYTSAWAGWGDSSVVLQDGNGINLSPVTHTNDGVIGFYQWNVDTYNLAANTTVFGFSATAPAGNQWIPRVGSVSMTVAPVPEPGSMATLAFGVLGLISRFKRTKRA